MKRRLSIFVVALLAASAAVMLAVSGGGATAATGRDSYGNCLRHAQSTLDMEQCVSTERSRLKPLLAAAYSTLLRDPDAGRRHRHLIAVSERAWTTYMKHDCIYAGAQAQGGTLQPVIEGECLVARTRTRIADLRAFAIPLGR